MTQYAIPMYDDGSLGCDTALDHEGDRQSLLKRMVLDYNEHEALGKPNGYLILDSFYLSAAPEILYVVPSVTFSNERP